MDRRAFPYSVAGRSPCAPAAILGICEPMPLCNGGPAMRARGDEMSGSIFDDVTLDDSQFHNVDMKASTFDDVALGGSEFSNVGLDKCDFEDVSFKGSVMSSVDL